MKIIQLTDSAMCIICNCGDSAYDFLLEFHRAVFHLEQAEHRLLECSKIDVRYDREHKRLVRFRKDLNRWFNEEREKNKEYDKAVVHEH